MNWLKRPWQTILAQWQSGKSATRRAAQAKSHLCMRKACSRPFSVLSSLSLAVALMLVLSCDHRDYERDYKRDYQGDAYRVQPRPRKVESAEPDRIRILLHEAEHLRLKCRGGGFELWQLMPLRQLKKWEIGENCHLSRKNGKWIVKSGSGKKNPLPIAAMDKLEFRPETGGLLCISQDKERAYRGVLRCVARGNNSFAVVSVLDMESYLAGVVGSEMPSYWHNAALRTQAIASRTYALYWLRKRKENNREWDLQSDQSSQVYGGVVWENQRVTQAVRQTRGVVLVYGDSEREELFSSYYSSSCGGHTQNAKPVFGESIEPLSGQFCPFCGAVAKPKHYRWSGVRVEKKRASSMLIERFSFLEPLEEIVDIEVDSRSDYGRMESLRLIGKNGKERKIRAEDLRLAVSTKENPLRSTWCELIDDGTAWLFENGHGWGHGVGMCQCGSQQMARLGKDCVDILKYYYPGSRLIRVY